VALNTVLVQFGRQSSDSLRAAFQLRYLSHLHFVICRLTVADSIINGALDVKPFPDLLTACMLTSALVYIDL
jgi:hypothetical protein